MRPARVHITGGSGAGTTTLGRALADAWSVPSFDTDDFYWQPTDPPFQVKREVPDRLALMQAMFLPRRAWVLSGSLMGWGDPLAAHFDLVVLLVLDPRVRMARLEAREALRYAPEDISPGGPLGEAHRTFMNWASRYDDPGFTGRSRGGHERWMATLPCPSICLDSAAPVDDLVAAITARAERDGRKT